MMTVVKLLEEKAKKYPENKVEVWKKESMTFREWDERSTRLARFLWDEVGIRKGDRVALMFSNEDAIAFKVSYFSVEKCGGISVPVNIRLPDEGIKHIVENSEAKVALCANEFEEKLKKLGKEAIPRRELEKIWSSYKNEKPPVEVLPDDYLDIIYTSGTTGFPKGVLSTHSSLFVRDSSQYENMFAGTTFVHAVPLFTFAGCHAMMMVPLHYGMNVTVLPKFDAKEYLAAISRPEVSMTYAVPAHLLLVMKLE